MSDEKDKGAGPDLPETGDSGTGDTESSVLNAGQFLEVFEIKAIKDSAKKSGYRYEMTVNTDLQEQLKSGAITREDFDKKIKDAQGFLTDGKDVKSGLYKSWMGTSGSDSEKMPILMPFTESDVHMAEALYLQQTENRFSDVWRAFGVEKDESGALSLKSKSSATPEDIEKAKKTLEKLDWTSKATVEKGASGESIDTYTPATEEEMKFMLRFYEYAAFSDIRQAFDIEGDKAGEWSFKSKASATIEDIVKAEETLRKLGWTSEDVTERGTRDDGSEYITVTYTPTTDTEKKIMSKFCAHVGIGDIYSKGYSGTISSKDSEGNISGGDKADNKGPTVHIDTGYGDGSGIFEERTPFFRKQFSEWMTPNSETLGDFFVDSIVNLTAKFNADMKLIYTWVLEWLQARDVKNAETLREYVLDKGDKQPGLFSKFISQVQESDGKGAKETLNRIWNLVENTSDQHADTKALKKTLEQCWNALEKNKDVLDTERGGDPASRVTGKDLAQKFSLLKEEFMCAAANKQRLPEKQPSLGDRLRSGVSTVISSLSTTRGGRGAPTP